MSTPEDNQSLRLKIIKDIDSHQDDLNFDPALKQFIVNSKDDTLEDIMSHNEILDQIQIQDDQDQIEWRFKHIIYHEGPLPRNYPNYNGSLYNAMIDQENGEITLEPSSQIEADDPVTCALCSNEHNFLKNPGWQRFKLLSKRGNQLFRLQNKAKLRSHRTSPMYRFGYEVPMKNSHEHAIQ